MKIVILAIISVFLIGCENLSGTAYNDWFAQSGLSTPHMWCRTYFDVDYYADSVMYLWRGVEPGGGGILMASGQRISANYRLQGVQHRWDWQNYSITVSPNGQGYYYDWSHGASQEKHPDYLCCAYTGNKPVCQ